LFCFVFGEAQQKTRPTSCWPAAEIRHGFHLHTCGFEPRTFFLRSQGPRQGYATQPPPLGKVKGRFLGYLTKQDEKREFIPFLGMQLA